MNRQTKHRKIAVAFFGITRALWKTLPSIETNVFDPIRSDGTLQVYSHLYATEFIDNPRSDEKGAMDVDEHELLESNWLCLESPGTYLECDTLKEISRFGDRFDDDFKSLQNLWQQLNSLAAVTRAMLNDGIEICVFCRPDLLYRESFEHWLSRALKANQPTVYLPSWQRFGGENDRFAICVGHQAITAYGERIQLANAYCSEFSSPLQGEGLLAFALAADKIKVRRIALRASRVRLGGKVKDERFEGPLFYNIRKKFEGIVKAIEKAFYL